jgi:hypothetical protein
MFAAHTGPSSNFFGRCRSTSEPAPPVAITVTNCVRNLGRLTHFHLLSGAREE